MIRTFICIELPSDIKGRIAELQQDLKKFGRGVRWSRPDGIHLTLKFLGDVESDKMKEIGERVAVACKGIAPFHIELAQLGAFPNFKRPRVFWLGADEKGGFLARLQKATESQLSEIGFPKEARDFSPHLTIGRVKSGDGLDALCKALQNERIEPMPFVVKQVVVMQSQLRPSGPLYTPLNVINL